MDGNRDAPSSAIEAKLPDGELLYVRVVDYGGISSAGRGGAPPDLEEALAPLGRVAALVRRQFEPLAVSRAQIEFGVSLSVQSGKLTTLIFESKAEASLIVTLEWKPPVSAAPETSGD